MKQKPLDAPIVHCPACGSAECAVAHTTETFQYGDGSASVQLSVPIAMYTCGSCGMQFSTSEIEDARHEAVCRHLGVLSPAELVAIRERYGLSQHDFARVSGIGRASLARWETGAGIQNASIDNFLYLIAFPENYARLIARSEPKPVETVEFTFGHFQALAGEEMTRARMQSASFTLLM